MSENDNVPEVPVISQETLSLQVDDEISLEELQEMLDAKTENASVEEPVVAVEVPLPEPIGSLQEEGGEISEVTMTAATVTQQSSTISLRLKVH